MFVDISGQLFFDLRIVFVRECAHRQSSKFARCDQQIPLHHEVRYWQPLFRACGQIRQ